jgi:O-Antigen ligase
LHIRRPRSAIGNKSLVLVTGLLMWGLPSVRFTPRSVEAAFSGLGGMDLTAWFQVGTCIFGALVVVIACGSRIGHGFSALPSMLFVGASLSFFIYSVFALSSAIYSVNAGFTIYSASKILLLLICSALLAGSYGGGPRGITACLRLFYTVNIMQWVVIASLFVLAPELVGTVKPNFGYRLYGGSFDDYGRAAAFSGFFFLLVGLRYHGRRRWWAFGGYAASWAFVLLSLTRGTIICALLIMCLAVGSKYRARMRILVTCATLLGVSVIALSGGLEQIVKFGARGQTSAELESLSGRAQAFHYLLNGWQQSPWLGFGYGAGSRYLLLHFQQQAGLEIGSAHDCLSRVLADLGITGALLLSFATIHVLIAACILWRRVRRRPELRELAVQTVAFVVYSVIFSITSSGVAELRAPLVMATLATSALRTRRRGLAVARRTPVYRFRTRQTCQTHSVKTIPQHS